MEDRRAHDRLDEIEGVVKRHLDDHSRLENNLAKNTALTQTIADNTEEIVSLVKGAKGLRSFVIWAAPIAAACAAVWSWIKAH